MDSEGRALSGAQVSQPTGEEASDARAASSHLIRSGHTPACEASLGRAGCGTAAAPSPSLSLRFATRRPRMRTCGSRGTGGTRKEEEREGGGGWEEKLRGGGQDGLDEI